MGLWERLSRFCKCELQSGFDKVPFLLSKIDFNLFQLALRCGVGLFFWRGVTKRVLSTMLP